MMQSRFSLKCRLTKSIYTMFLQGSETRNELLRIGKIHQHFCSSIGIHTVYVSLVVKTKQYSRGQIIIKNQRKLLLFTVCKGENGYIGGRANDHTVIFTPFDFSVFPYRMLLSNITAEQTGETDSEYFPPIIHHAPPMSFLGKTVGTENTGVSAPYPTFFEPNFLACRYRIPRARQAP